MPTPSPENTALSVPASPVNSLDEKQAWAEQNADFIREYNERVEREGPILSEFSQL